jgi:hypothetical protein
MFYATTTKNCLPKKNVCLSVCVCVTSHSYLGTYVLTPYVYSDILTRCHVTDINHVLTRCHVTEINYVDRGAAARAPLQSLCNTRSKKENGAADVASRKLSSGRHRVENSLAPSEPYLN